MLTSYYRNESTIVYIQGYQRNRAYIATQGIMSMILIDIYINTGPIPSTIIDFWRMIWEYKLPTIVMLTQLIEKGIVSKNSIDTII